MNLSENEFFRNYQISVAGVLVLKFSYNRDAIKTLFAEFPRLIEEHYNASKTTEDCADAMVWRT